MHNLIEFLPVLIFAQGNLGSFVSSVFTPQGTNAASGLQQEQQQVGQQVTNQYGNLLPGSGQLAQSNLAYAQQLQPYAQEALSRGIYANTQQSALANAQAEGNAANSNAAQQAKQTQLALGAQGAGTGAVQGATAGAFGQAAQQANQAENQALSPQAVNERLMSRIQLLNQSQSPSFGALQQSGSGELGASFGTPKPQVSPSPLAGIAGTLAGGAAQGNLW